MDTQNRYNVHLYLTVRVEVRNVEAPDGPAAIEKSIFCGPDFYRLFESSSKEGAEPVWLSEFAEEIGGALVDVVGDEDYEQSVYYQRSEQTSEWEPFGQGDEGSVLVRDWAVQVRRLDDGLEIELDHLDGEKTDSIRLKAVPPAGEARPSWKISSKRRSSRKSSKEEAS